MSRMSTGGRMSLGGRMCQECLLVSTFPDMSDVSPAPHQLGETCNNSKRVLSRVQQLHLLPSSASNSKVSEFVCTGGPPPIQ